jgi:MFS family permease
MTSTPIQADRAPRPAQDAVGAHRHRRQLSQGAAFWVVASAFATVMAFGTVPTPLWPLYEARDHFGPTTVTMAFAAMVAGAAAVFSTLGHLSDRIGRRRVMVPALLTTCLAAAVMAESAAGQLVLGRLSFRGRFRTGIALFPVGLALTAVT